jgi:hypothetical protein
MLCKFQPPSKVNYKQKGPTFFAKLKNFFAKLIFSRQNFFGILEEGNLFEQKKFGGKKINLAKKFFNLAKTIFPKMAGNLPTRFPTK